MTNAERGSVERFFSLNFMKFKSYLKGTFLFCAGAASVNNAFEFEAK